MCLLVKLFASVAQLVEQLTCNQLVGGSSPSTGSVAVAGGCAGVGEPGQTVNLVSLTEWVRIQLPPQREFSNLSFEDPKPYNLD